MSEKREDVVIESDIPVAAALVFHHLVERRAENFPHVRFALAANFTSQTTVTVHEGAGVGDAEHFDRECHEARAFAVGYLQCMTDMFGGELKGMKR